MWQWYAQTPGYSAFTRMSKRWPGATARRVRHVPVRRVEHEPVLRHDLEVVAVEVHRMDLRTVVRQVDQDVVAERRDDRLGGGELLAVQHEARRTIAQEHRVLDGDVGPVEGSPVIRLRLDEEGPVQALADLLRRVEMRVVHVHAGPVHDLELVHEEPAGRDRVLRDERHAVHVVGDGQAVEVHDRRLCHLVVHDDQNVVAPVDTDLGARNGSVVRHRVHEHARRGLPPHLGRREVEDLHAVLVPRLERLVPEPVGLRRERCDARLVSIEHLFGAHGAAGRAHRTRRSGCGYPALLHHQRAHHAGFPVA